MPRQLIRSRPPLTWKKGTIIPSKRWRWSKGLVIRAATRLEAVMEYERRRPAKGYREFHGVELDDEVR